MTGEYIECVRCKLAGRAHLTLRINEEGLCPDCEKQVNKLKYDQKYEPNTSKVNRFEVIDDNGRLLVKYGVKVELSFQDDDRTLKVFLTEGEPVETPDWEKKIIKKGRG